ncbi:MAG: LAGLIDADG family homing endonuclease [Candidatus Heimdallarchaeaceae archaeon]
MTEPINWLNDPLLLDSEPIPMNDWLTANKILESEAPNIISFIDLETLTLNLYSILIRKTDFVKGKDSDRILSRFPFLVLTDDEKTLIKNKILLIAEFARDYFYRSVNSGIMDWKRRLATYLKRGAMPYPLYRCASAILDFPMTNPNVDEVFFESARGKRYSIPTKLTNALAYLCGVVNGDGHLHRHFVKITDETKEFMQLLSKLYEQKFNDPGEIFLTGNAWNVELRSSAFVRIINFLTDHTIEGAKYDSLREPLLFKKLGAPFRYLYWRGAMDADGSFKNKIGFTSVSEKLVLNYQSFLKENNIESRLIKNNDEVIGLYLLAIDKLRYVELIGSLNPKKSDDLFDYLQHNKKYVEFQGLKKDVLSKEGYYNFDLLESLFIFGLGNFLKDFRSSKSYGKMDELFDMAQGSFSNMEKNNRGLPYPMLKKIIENSYSKTTTVFEILNDKKYDITYQVANSTPITLPLKPLNELETILPYLKPKIGYILVSKVNDKIKTNLTEIFSIKITNSRINCRLLLHFLNTFYNYSCDFPTLSVKEFYAFKKLWRDELFS